MTGQRTQFILRMEKDTAQRVVARLLREKLNPDDANKFAAKICDGIQASMKQPTRPGLSGWKMIPRHLPHHQERDFERDVHRLVTAEHPYAAADLWEAVYKYGTEIPDDIVV